MDQAEHELEQAILELKQELHIKELERTHGPLLLAKIKEIRGRGEK